MNKVSEADIKALIRRRRAQMLVHSYLYYESDQPIISDDQWQEWANELELLQSNFPKLCKINYYDKEFADWDGTTGNHLPRTVIVKGQAEQVLRSYQHVMEIKNE
jgi:NAD-dependent DNA ligase